ncbi:hypothetical protein QSV34_06130 [Porticoccus sp. W117]|uniref:hypothetical protein n=1 Tax=Porticoccus sp. W117 TaxID=3054777 RepID=UPI0025952FC7|nr:hypothetical protein [Porticoccus sp. W117]MDM3870931.1 hypothetical protein [Porticoccus sp. W117]
MEKNYKNADKIFLGELASSTRNHEGKLLVRVLERLKGHIQEVELVETGDGGGDCGLGVDPDSEYLIFVGEDNHANICNGSTRASSVGIIVERFTDGTVLNEGVDPNKISQDHLEKIRKLSSVYKK